MVGVALSHSMTSISDASAESNQNEGQRPAPDEDGGIFALISNVP